ncbi:recombinase family protein [Crossiella sp. S99.2]|uniref:recombinase family protein n=1 Tax=unclassified Crossiella TaxID=2620835 RepID=UPI0035AC1E4B
MLQSRTTTRLQELHPAQMGWPGSLTLPQTDTRPGGLLRGVAGPPALYGYNRVPKQAIAQSERVRLALATWCRAQHYTLRVVFTDWGAPPAEAEAPGLRRLLTVLAQQDAPGVVVPALEHLSPHPDGQARIRQYITGCGAHLVVMTTIANQPHAHLLGA